MTTRDPWERIVSVHTTGLYESNYLKANSPDGRRGLWIKHNLLRRSDGSGIGEFWVIVFEKGSRPTVAKLEADWSELTLDGTAIGIQCGPIALRPDRAIGEIADISWDLRLTPTMPPLHHFPADWMYTAPFPKKKAITPAPNLRFSGWVDVSGQRLELTDWVGLRGHNWGREHAHTYAYGNCNLWDDEADRTVDGFSARIRLPGGLLSPWLSTLVARAPDKSLNRVQHWTGGSEVTPNSWRLRTGGCELLMDCDPSTYVGLRYLHPSGAESYCYNTKFASVEWTTPEGIFKSKLGELEVLTPDPIDGILLHPSPDWDPLAGPYRS
jgi:hypothetical protein